MCTGCSGTLPCLSIEKILRLINAFASGATNRGAGNLACISADSRRYHLSPRKCGAKNGLFPSHDVRLLSVLRRFMQVISRRQRPSRIMLDESGSSDWAGASEFAQGGFGALSQTTERPFFALRERPLSGSLFARSTVRSWPSATADRESLFDRSADVGRWSLFDTLLTVATVRSREGSPPAAPAWQRSMRAGRNSRVAGSRRVVHCRSFCKCA